MRFLAFTTLLMLALAGLALAPQAAAAPLVPAPGLGCTGALADACSTTSSADPSVPPCACPPLQCAGITTVGPLDQVVSVTLTSDCRVIVALLVGLVDCGDPLDGAKAFTVGRVTVVAPCGQVDYCEPPFDCPPASAESASAGPIACPYPVGGAPIDEKVGPIGVHSDCGPQDLCSGPFRCTSPIGPISSAGTIGCPYPVGGEPIDEKVGPIGVHSDCGPQDLCSGPFRCTSPFQSSARPLPVHASVSTDPPHLDVYEDADVTDCLWSEGYTDTEVGPLLTIHVWGCKGPPQESTSSASPPCICPPPKPLCYQVNRAIAWGDQVSADDYCNVTVTLDAYCGLQGTPENHYVNASKVHVRYQTCQGPPPASAGVEQVPPCACPAPAPLCRPVNELIASGEGPVTFTLDDYCHVTVTVDLAQPMPCNHTDKTVRAGPVTVIVPLCSDCQSDPCPPPPASTAGVQQVPPCACPPPAPLCYQVSRALAASPYYSIDDYCNVTVTLDADCGLQGYPEDHQVKAPKVTVDFQTCKYVPPS